jgi:NADPH2:quinone reductase
VRAIVVRRFGGPEVLRPTEVAEPEPAPGHVLIEVELASVTFVETQQRAGRPPHPGMAPRLPWIPGNGVGGVVALVGAGVDARFLGVRVVSATGGSGGYASRVVVPADGLLAVPDAVPLSDATALLADGRTAIALARTAEIHEGETVLVLAAGGGVGSLLVQLAVRSGAVAVGAASSQRKLALARELGATHTVDYTRPGWVDDLVEVDVVFDGVGGELGLESLARVRPGGRVLSFGQASGTFTESSTGALARRGVTMLRGTGARPDESRALSAIALAEAAAGRLRPHVGQLVPLERAADAHAAIEARTTLGKTLLST